MVPLRFLLLFSNNVATTSASVCFRDNTFNTFSRNARPNFLLNEPGINDSFRKPTSLATVSVSVFAAEITTFLLTNFCSNHPRADSNSADVAVRQASQSKTRNNQLVDEERTVSFFANSFAFGGTEEPVKNLLSSVKTIWSSFSLESSASLSVQFFTKHKTSVFIIFNNPSAFLVYKCDNNSIGETNASKNLVPWTKLW